MGRITGRREPAFGRYAGSRGLPPAGEVVGLFPEATERPGDGEPSVPLPSQSGCSAGLNDGTLAGKTMRAGVAPAAAAEPANRSGASRTPTPARSEPR